MKPSKRPSKKLSGDQERSRKRKKSKSSMRRRRVSSVSSYSSSDSKGVRRKVSKKLEKRKRESKKSDKRKSRKSRSRRDVSVGFSSRSSSSCSTCRGRSSDSSGSASGQSRSPDRKLKLRGRERGRERERVRRYRSRSSSSCGGSRSSMSRSGESPRRRSWSCSGERGKEFEQPKRTRLVLAASKQSRDVETRRRIRDDNEEMDKIIKAYDDFPASQSNDRFDAKKRKLDAYQETLEEGEIRKDVESNWVDSGIYVKEADKASAKTDKQLLVDGDASSDHFTWNKTENVKKNNSDSFEADKLELLLRKKALENLIKFRGGVSTAARKIGEAKTNSDQTQLYKDSGGVVEVQNAVKSLDSILASSLRCQGGIQGGKQPREPGVRPAVKIPSDEVAASQVTSHQNATNSTRALGKPGLDYSGVGRRTPNHVNRMEELSNKHSTEHTSLASDRQDKSTAAKPGSSTLNDSKVSIADGKSASGVSANLNMEALNEQKDEDTGSHFQQKTFSRMHDGQLVQVSYLVRIPKKTPALARRKLQR